MIKLISLTDEEKVLEVSLDHASNILLLEQRLGNKNYKLPSGYEFDGKTIKKAKKKNDSNDSGSETANSKA